MKKNVVYGISLTFLVTGIALMIAMDMIGRSQRPGQLLILIGSAFALWGTRMLGFPDHMAKHSLIAARLKTLFACETASAILLTVFLAVQVFLAFPLKIVIPVGVVLIICFIGSDLWFFLLIREKKEKSKDV